MHAARAGITHFGDRRSKVKGQGQGHMRRKIDLEL